MSNEPYYKKKGLVHGLLGIIETAVHFLITLKHL